MVDPVYRQVFLTASNVVIAVLRIAMLLFVLRIRKFKNNGEIPFFGSFA